MASTSPESSRQAESYPQYSLPWQQYGVNQATQPVYHHPIRLQQPVTQKISSSSPEPEEPVVNWDEALKQFFISMGLIQALRGFEEDMLIMNPEFERIKMGQALKTLLEKFESLKSGSEPTRPLDERKLDYVRRDTTDGVQGSPPVQPQSSVIKSVSQFLTANRARNDVSNRAEFLLKYTQGSARTHPKSIERDLQMKYDIAKNEEGPLRKTVVTLEKGKKKRKRGEEERPAPAVKQEGGDATEERLKNIEEHIAVKYVPSVPKTFHARLAFLEEHIAFLEKEYPPWAALQFNQPNRGWPPPPRPTPIIVPPELRPNLSTMSSTGVVEGSNRGESSSLLRAVMDRLQVQKAMSDLDGK